MRISDWSSDVCSSDLRIMLLTALPPAPPTPTTVILGFSSRGRSGMDRLMVIDASRCERWKGGWWGSVGVPPRRGAVRSRCSQVLPQPGADFRQKAGCPIDRLEVVVGVPALFAARSEEHTSELQSLMRISYA